MPGPDVRGCARARDPDRCLLQGGGNHETLGPGHTPAARRGRVARVRRRSVDPVTAALTCRPARQGRPRPVLDVLVHQLASHGALPVSYTHLTLPTSDIL